VRIEGSQTLIDDGSTALSSTRSGRVWFTAQSLHKLEELLEDAWAVAASEVPETVVTMNATAELADDTSGALRRVTVVYPQDAEDVPDGASVTDPLGIALLGCQVGDVLQCPGETGHGYRIAEVER
jgi:regulator of nucleoside diphosphate kinase